MSFTRTAGYSFATYPCVSPWCLYVSSPYTIFTGIKGTHERTVRTVRRTREGLITVACCNARHYPQTDRLTSYLLMIYDAWSTSRSFAREYTHYDRRSWFLFSVRSDFPHHTPFTRPCLVLISPMFAWICIISRYITNLLADARRPISISITNQLLLGLISAEEPREWRLTLASVSCRLAMAR